MVSNLFLLNDFFSNVAYPEQNGRGYMDGWGHMVGYPFGGAVMMIFILVAVALIVYFLVKKNSQKEANAMDILKKRYARGEISKEEFQKMKEDLEE
ncbi:SHOCT domain-containing protein [Desulfohalobiaceae bacterium Ax17]|uniref:SHOCT domain-containing protein n=1 Tax=Desulfovulcanus ferrireducens TaxID=2831190 RepID=UPI00207BBDF1|nr:SHOCT domain-containing protein [Desulfovulcanus ferrireducens]MBT8764078.1 SHOCT domain-containing protein [Desulfovulcanus ferrireducens]